MFRKTTQSAIVCILACTIPLATAQKSQDVQRDFYRQQKEDKTFWEAKSQAEKRDGDATVENLKRYNESSQNPSYGQGGDGTAAALLLATTAVIIGGLLLDWSRRPERKLTPEEYAKITQRQRQSFMHRQCKAIRQSTLVYPRYDKPNSHALIRIFQSDRASEYKAALAKFETELAESEPTCKCVSERSVSEGGFTEADWKEIAVLARRERPWMALEEARVRGVFESCAVQSPSDKSLSWLYVSPTR